jgi:hypothetical protein
MTLGPSLTLLGLLDKAKAERGLSRILMVFGRVPLFYYVLHLYLIHILAILVALAFHQPVLHGSVIADFATKPAGYGHGLPFIYSMWILAVAILYLPCLWFMKFRSRHRDWTGSAICDRHQDCWDRDGQPTTSGLPLLSI